MSTTFMFLWRNKKKYNYFFWLEKSALSEVMFYFESLLYIWSCAGLHLKRMHKGPNKMQENTDQVGYFLLTYWLTRNLFLEKTEVTHPKHKHTSNILSYMPTLKTMLRSPKSNQFDFVCVEDLRPSQPSGVKSSVVSLPNHMFTRQP